MMFEYAHSLFTTTVTQMLLDAFGKPCERLTAPFEARVGRQYNKSVPGNKEKTSAICDSEYMHVLKTMNLPPSFKDVVSKVCD